MAMAMAMPMPMVVAAAFSTFVLGLAPVLVMVVMLVAARARGRGHHLRVREIRFDRRRRVGLLGGHGNDAPARHALGEAGTKRSGDDDIDGVEWVRSFAFEFME